MALVGCPGLELGLALSVALGHLSRAVLRWRGPCHRPRVLPTSASAELVSVRESNPNLQPLGVWDAPTAGAPAGLRAWGCPWSPAAGPGQVQGWSQGPRDGPRLTESLAGHTAWVGGARSRRVGGGVLTRCLHLQGPFSWSWCSRPEQAVPSACCHVTAPPKLGAYSSRTPCVSHGAAGQAPVRSQSGCWPGLCPLAPNQVLPAGPEGGLCPAAGDLSLHLGLLRGRHGSGVRRAPLPCPCWSRRPQRVGWRVRAPCCPCA